MTLENKSNENVQESRGLRQVHETSTWVNMLWFEAALNTCFLVLARVSILSTWVQLASASIHSSIYNPNFSSITMIYNYFWPHPLLVSCYTNYFIGWRTLTWAPAYTWSDYGCLVSFLSAIFDFQICADLSNISGFSHHGAVKVFCSLNLKTCILLSVRKVWGHCYRNTRILRCQKYLSKWDKNVPDLVLDVCFWSERRRPTKQLWSQEP